MAEGHIARFSYMEKFFTLHSSTPTEKCVDLQFQCVLCLPLLKYIKTSTQSPYSNLKLHMKRLHTKLSAEFEELIRSAIAKRKKTVSFDLSFESTSSTPAKVAKKDFFSITQNGVNKAVARYIVRRNEPFCLVEDDAFRDLIATLLPSYKPICYRNVLSIIQNDYEKMMDYIKKLLAQAEYVCVSTDGWSFSCKSFLDN